MESGSFNPTNELLVKSISLVCFLKPFRFFFFFEFEAKTKGFRKKLVINEMLGHEIPYFILWYRDESKYQGSY